ncbi:hypothetical protein [Gimesia maris]|uniref:hypothetical protein n=1 Tax=Gimesia maris TaxID=122 RepID=UPI0030DBE095
MIPKHLTAMKSKDLIVYILFAISAIVALPLCTWLLLAPYGSGLILCVAMMYLFSFLAALVMLPIMLVRLCWKQTRARALLWLLVIVVYVPCFLLGNAWERRVWTARWEAFSHRSQPLIAAINDYERQHGAPPESLTVLVPDYLPAVPDTGIRACSEFQYFTGEDARQQYAGNPWALQVLPPVFGVGFDLVLYFPKQAYPEKGYGGWLERVGEWAYVHE